MAGTPGPNMSRHPAVSQQQQQQDYMRQFEQSAYAPIPNPGQGGLFQSMGDVLRAMNNYGAGQYGQDQPIPIPGQPTSYQIPATGILGNFSPEMAQYINQDVTGFNQQGTIPGVGGTPQPLPGGRPPTQIPPPMNQGPQFQPRGAYGRQALNLAGLLGNTVPTPQQPTAGYQGLLGGGKGAGFRIPGYGGGK